MKKLYIECTLQNLIEKYSLKDIRSINNKYMKDLNLYNRLIEIKIKLFNA